MPAGFGKLLIVAGAVLVVLGVLYQLSGRIPWLGRLPGDIMVKRGNFSYYLPVTTSILISLFVTLLLWLFRR